MWRFTNSSSDSSPSDQCWEFAEVRGRFQAVRVSEKRLFQKLRGKWRYLRNHAGFQQAPLTAISRLIRWRLHCALGIPAIVNVSPWGARLFLPPQWRGAGTTMIFAVRGHYEKELAYLRHFVSPGMVVVDGGANCGIYSVAAGRLVGPSGRVIAFEPSDRPERQMSRAPLPAIGPEVDGNIGGRRAHTISNRDFGSPEAACALRCRHSATLRFSAGLRRARRQAVHE